MNNETAKVIAIWAGSAIAISVATIVTKSALPIGGFFISFLATMVV